MIPKPRLYFLLSLGLYCLTIGSTSFAELPGAGDKLSVININATDLTPLNIGLEIGHQTKALIPDIERRYDTYLVTVLTQTEFDDISRHSLPKLLKRLDAAYQEELKGVAGAWSLTHVDQLGDGLLSLNEYRLLNLMTDFGLAPDGSGFGVMGEASGENGPIIGRNQDWETISELRTLQAITVYQYEEQVIVNIGFAGIVSVLAGFNDQGLFLAYFNAEPHSPYRQAYRVPDDVNAVTFALRKTLETAHTGRQAIRRLASNVYGFGNNILVADKKNIQVLEYSVAETASVRNWDSALHAGEHWGRVEQIAVVGCHMLAALANNCKDVKDTVRWQRLRELARFSAAQPAEISDLSAILFDTANDRYEIFNRQTLQSLIYLPANNSVYLYAMPPAGNQASTPFHQAYLDLLPAEFDNKGPQEDSIDIVWLTWLLLIGMLGVVLWVMQRPDSNRTSEIRG